MPNKMMKSDERSNFKTLIINQSKRQDFNKKQMLSMVVIKKPLSWKQLKKPWHFRAYKHSVSTY